jgi:hypothetical protein
MTYKIDKKIVGYKVVKDGEGIVSEVNEIKDMHEGIKRSEVLTGKTYKITPPAYDHAVYITINDMELDGKVYPYEIFINSKNLESFQWVLALTRLISATWRKGGNTHFLIEELKAVFDPHGGYYSGKKFYPSLVAHIGSVIEKHLGGKEDLSVEQKEYIESKGIDISEGYPANATLCGKCGERAVVIIDNCATCLSCADSKCG